ncbi:hypothetical protein ABZ622_36285 [Streptomyces sp. NPDC007164]|uniref:hypothetical protein n=1 Tax=Streptomyces sp. NPDC007164 TaxID=3156918 RepID=UPI0033DA060C
MLLRQITTCTDPATTVIERRSQKAGQALQYRLGTCRRHRWLARDWRGLRTRSPGEGRCGTVIDYRSYERIVQSHADLWIGPSTTQYLQMHGGDVARTLRAAHAFKAHAADDWVRRPREIETAMVAVLDHAARLAEAIEAEQIDVESGRGQLLAALSACETIDAAERGA